MPTYNPERQLVVSTVASLTKWHPEDPRLPGLRAELVTMRLVEHITKAVSATTLTSDQRARVVKAVYGNLGNG